MKKNLILLFVTGFCLVGSSQTLPSYLPADSLVAWFPFNGNIADESGKGNTATNHGATLSADRFGFSNSAYNFNGFLNQYLSVLNKTLPMGKSKRTISLWVNPAGYVSPAQALTAFSYGQPSMSNANSVALIYPSSVAYQGWNDDLTAYYPFSNFQWMNITVIFDSLFVRTYVNGNLIAYVINLNWNTIGTECYIGGRVNPVTNFFNGKIDDVAVWNRDLTDSEIKKVVFSCDMRITRQPADSTLMIADTARFVTAVNRPNASFQWQIDRGTGFQNLNNSGQFLGAKKDTLCVMNLNSTNHNQRFRCLLSSSFCNDTTLQVTLTVNNNFSPIPFYIPKDSLVAWFPFNGNAEDESGNGNTGLSLGAVLTSDRSGNTEKAFSFNGFNKQYISCINNKMPMGYSKRSISLWLNPSSFVHTSQTLTALSYGMASTSNANMIGLNYPATLAYKGWGDDINATLNFSMNDWMHALVTFDSIHMNLYANNNLVGSGSVQNWFTQGNSFFIGAQIDTTNNYFNGKIDEIAVWNRVLSDTEIKQVFNTCKLSESMQPQNDTAKIGSQARFMISYPDSSAKFQWQLNNGSGFQNIVNGGQFGGANNDTLIVSNLLAGNNNQLYRCMINLGSCRDTTYSVKLTVTNNTGIIEGQEENEIIFYPNPAHTTLHFTWDSRKYSYNYTLFDATGRILQTHVFDENNKSISIEYLEPGYYFIRINDSRFPVFHFIKN